MKKPIEELIEKLRDLNSRGWINSEGTGSGRYGLALERELSIPRNSSKNPDFKGIELKTKASAKLQTLFSRTPSRHTGCSNNLDLIQSWGYKDKKTGRQQLYTSINCEGDSLGFSIKHSGNHIQVLHDDTELLQYDIIKLENALLSKHRESAFIDVETRKLGNQDQCRFNNLLYCKHSSIGKFLSLLNKGRIYLDFTLSVKDGRSRDHGFLWRIKGNLKDLYETSLSYQLD